MLLIAAFLAVQTPAEQIKLIENAVKAKLKDPDSAKFEWPNGFVRYTPANGVETSATCGTVNARNGFGGYTGRMAVLGAIDKGVAAVAIDDPTVKFAPVRRTCADIGVPVGN